jgi:hypothetical protein
MSEPLTPAQLEELRSEVESDLARLERVFHMRDCQNTMLINVN